MYHGDMTVKVLDVAHAVARQAAGLLKAVDHREALQVRARGRTVDVVLTFHNLWVVKKYRIAIPLFVIFDSNK